MSRTVIHWFRRDLRLTDNMALHQAARQGDVVVPVYVLSTWKRKHGWTGSARQQFLCGCLESLAGNLQAIGSRLIVRAGEADKELGRLIDQAGASALYFNRDYDPYGREMEKRVRALCGRKGIACHEFKDRVLHEPDEVLTGDGQPYRVYTPYSRNWLGLEKPNSMPRVKTLGALDGTIDSIPLPGLDYWKLQPTTADLPAPGERVARARMKQFIEDGRLASYAAKRNTPFGLTTSRLGQDLRFGLISIRELYSRAMDAARPDGKPAPAKTRDSIQTYIKELAWREFYLAILCHYPEVFETEFNPAFRDMPWPGGEEAFVKWSQGRTGFPMVDAGMRELLATGFMHNRVRMIVSMFLTKDLHCHWRLGESHFMRHLVDGENASNNGGWQWSAGTGADAAPYFRIQNPWTQTKTYDPDGAYIRQWVPELREVDAARFFSPPADGKPIAPDYPLPMVDHAVERERCLARFAKFRQEQS